jgi:hypothetical protein
MARTKNVQRLRATPANGAATAQVVPSGEGHGN